MGISPDPLRGDAHPVRQVYSAPRTPVSPDLRRSGILN